MSYAVMRQVSLSGSCSLFEALSMDSQNREYWTYPGPHATLWNDKNEAQAVADRLTEEYKSDCFYIAPDCLPYLFIVRDSNDRKIYTSEVSLQTSDNILSLAHSVMQDARMFGPDIECCEVWQRNDNNHMSLLVTAF